MKPRMLSELKIVELLQDRLMKRTMRIIDWSKCNPSGYTLVLEWFDDHGNCVKDERRQMEKEEFDGLAKSVMIALDAQATGGES